MKVASFDVRYRLTVPPGTYDVRDAAGRYYTVSPEMEWVRWHSARSTAEAFARAHPAVRFTIEVCEAAGHARMRWRPLWYSPAAQRGRWTLLGRLRRALFVLAGEKSNG